MRKKRTKCKTNVTLHFSLPPTQEVFTEMEEKYGEVEEMNVCDNLGDHLVGNVYVKVGVASISHICSHNCNAMDFSLYPEPVIFFVFSYTLSVLCSSVMKKMQRRL